MNFKKLGAKIDEFFRPIMIFAYCIAGGALIIAGQIVCSVIKHLAGAH